MKKTAETPQKPAVKEVRHWRRPDVIAIKRDPRFGYRLVKKDNVAAKQAEGWEICKDNEMLGQEAFGMESGTSHYRELILMRMPIHMCQERKQYYLDLHLGRLRASSAGMQIKEAARKENQTHKKPGLVSTIGNVAIKTQTRDHKGLLHTSELEIDPREATGKDLEELAKARES